MDNPKIVVMGGGTGTYTVLTGLKNLPVELSAIVTMSDNGGSTGVLRDEYGVLPPGDVRQCLVALATGDFTLRKLFNYRYPDGPLKGHTFGNLFLSTLEKLSGNPLQAVREAHRILNVKGRVLPVTAEASNLFAELEDGTVIEGEHAIDQPAGERAPIRRCFLDPQVDANLEALETIRTADAIVIGPGDLYTSLIPVLLVNGVVEALVECRARRIFVLNLTTKAGQTETYGAKKFCDVLANVIAPAEIDAVIINSAQPPSDIAQRYEEAGECLVADDLAESRFRTHRLPLVASGIARTQKGDALKRSLLRHDPDMLARAILDIIQAT